MTLRLSYALALLSQGLNVLAQTSQAQFNQVINLNGDMQLNSLQFPDGSRVETYSQTQRQMLVNQNQAPLPGNQVTGTTGNPFMQLSTNSLVIQTNGATDLVGAQIELPLNTQIMAQNGISPDNTFVAKLANDRQSWMVMDTIKTVNNTDNTVRIVKMNNVDGEYIALGRQTPVTGVSLTQFGTDPTTNFNITGSGIQENEFNDGFRMSVRATQPMTINMNVINGISTTMLQGLGAGTQSVNNYRYLVTTNLGGVTTNLNRMAAVMQLPINPLRLQAVAQGMGASAQSNVRLSIAQRGILSNPGGATNIQGGVGIPLQKRQQPPPPGPNGQTNTGAPAQPNTGAPAQPNTGAPGQTNTGTNGQTNTGNGQINNGGTGTINNNPAATRLLLSPTFTPIQANAVLDAMNGRLAVPVTQVDGEYIITVNMANGQGVGQAPQAGVGQGQQGVGAQPVQGGQGIGAQPVPGQGVGAQPVQGQPGVGAQPTAAEPRPAGEPAGARPQQPAGETAPRPAGERPAGETAARPASESRPAGETAPGAPAAEPARPTAPAAPPAEPVRETSPTPPAAEPAPTSQPAASTGSGFVFKRQAPAVPQPQPDGSVIVSMEWINYMAQIKLQGGAVDVGAMMQQVSPGIAQATGPGNGASGVSGVSGLISGLKARRFQA